MTKVHSLLMVFAVAVLASSGVLTSPTSVAFGSPKPFQAEPEEGGEPAVVFTGDVMLARKVDYHTATHGAEYPFLRLGSLKERGHVVFNFESAMTTPHKRTPHFTFRFATPSSTLPALSPYGFSHASLANNHAYDFGESGFHLTKTELEAHGVVPFGQSSGVSSSSITYLEVDGGTVAVVALNTVSGLPDTAMLTDVLAEAGERSDVQVAYVHWGTEYQIRHSKSQEAFARTLVSGGIDLIVGHHPHVVQDVGLVDGVPVFYSLGNFIFDQYFSQDVQAGLLVELSLKGEYLQIEALPVTSIDRESAPRFMNSSERAAFLKQLAARSAPELQDSLEAGSLTIPF